jgi:hypothetical protein
MSLSVKKICMHAENFPGFPGRQLDCTGKAEWNFIYYKLYMLNLFRTLNAPMIEVKYLFCFIYTIFLFQLQNAYKQSIMPDRNFAKIRPHSNVITVFRSDRCEAQMVCVPFNNLTGLAVLMEAPMIPLARSNDFRHLLNPPLDEDVDGISSLSNLAIYVMSRSVISGSHHPSL